MRISVITAIHAASLPYIEAAHDSLTAQRLPKHVEWEWCIQGDGTVELPASVLADRRVAFALNPPSGPGPTRNMALARATGAIIKNLDSDDLLTPEAMARDLDAYRLPGVAWTTATALDLMPDGSTAAWKYEDPKVRTAPPGWIVSEWKRANWDFLPVLPGTMSMRRELAVALGGWMALPSSEDTGLLVAANTFALGVLIPEPGLLYRKHRAQATRTEGHTDSEQAETRRRLILARAAALRDCATGNATASIAELAAALPD